MVTPMSRGRRRLYLFGTLVLLAIAIGWPLSRSWRAYAAGRPVRPIHVARGSEATLADARWRMLTLTTDAPGDASRSRTLPPNTVVVRARFTVIPGQRTDSKQLAACRARVRDAQGRHWDSFGVGRRGGVSSNCGSATGADFKPITAKVGQPWTFEFAFAVPQAVAGEVEPEIIVPKQFPRYLRFTR